MIISEKCSLFTSVMTTVREFDHTYHIHNLLQRGVQTSAEKKNMNIQANLLSIAHNIMILLWQILW